MIRAIGIAACLIGVMFTYPQHRANGRDVNQHASQHAPQTYPSSQPRSPNQPKRASYTADYQRACNKPNDATEADLCQQWRVAEASEKSVEWAPWQFILTTIESFLLLLTVAFTGWAAYAASRAAKASDESASAAAEANRQNRESLVVQQRAWLALKNAKIVGPIVWTGYESRLKVQFVFKNIGQTPAKRANLIALVYCSVDIEFTKEYQKMFDSQRERGIHANTGYTIFPDEIHVENWDIEISTKETIENIKRTHNIDGDVAIFPRLVGCMTYQLAFDNAVRQTGFIFNVTRNPSPDGVIAIGPGFGDIPREQLDLRRNFLGDIMPD